MYRVQVCKNGLYVGVVRIKDEEDIFDIAEIIYDLVLLCLVCDVYSLYVL
jgi:hypothetical protein